MSTTAEEPAPYGTGPAAKPAPDIPPPVPAPGWSATLTGARWAHLAGHAGYGYCASHSRYFWGLRLHLVTTVHGWKIGLPSRAL